MCGILFQIISNSGPSIPSDTNLESLRRRGPDFSASSIVEFPTGGNTCFVFSSVLSQQGSDLFPQPSVISGPLFKGVLLWNGEIYNHITVGGETTSDTEFLTKKIGLCSSVEEILGIFTSINGPFAFVLIEPSADRIFFGRDRFGRRSLVCQVVPKTQTVVSIASVVLPPQSDCHDSQERWCEVPASGVYSAILTNHFGLTFDHWYPWSDDHAVYWSDSQLHEVWKIHRCGEILYKNESSKLSTNSTVENLLCLLSEAVKLRVGHSSPSCNHCFRNSDVVSHDCSHARIGVLYSGGVDSAILAALADRHVPSDQPIDLLNVAFEHLNSKFSVINGRPLNQNKSASLYSSADLAPDRVTALSGLKELQKLNPSRKWQLVLINVSVDEMRFVRKLYVQSLVRPCPQTTLNDSLALALWFAAKGQGRIVSKLDGEEPILSEEMYTSTARVVLVGSGADEQLAGYSRHRNTFNRDGAEAVERELKLEMQRISERNLGRDDRMISDHGRESRFPYLDEKVVSYLSSLPLAEKADFSLPRGVGEKQLLRRVALLIGLQGAAILPKRALQFGSRVSKAEHLQKIHGADTELVQDCE